MKCEGYRYVRSYLTSKGERWALWEVVSGRSTRVGTALTENGYRLFLGVPTVPRYRYYRRPRHPERGRGWSIYRCQTCKNGVTIALTH